MSKLISYNNSQGTRLLRNVRKARMAGENNRRNPLDGDPDYVRYKSVFIDSFLILIRG